jgi:hypothetical protein
LHAPKLPESGIHKKLRGGAGMGISTVSLLITFFLMVMVLAMQFQIGQINRKIDQLLGFNQK